MRVWVIGIIYITGLNEERVGCFLHNMFKFRGFNLNVLQLACNYTAARKLIEN